MKCIIHHDIDAVGTCVGCGKGLCGYCKREIGMKLYCQTCARERLSQKTVPPAPFANGEKMLKVGNDLPRIDERGKASKLSTAAFVCGILGVLGIGGGIFITVIVLIANGGMMHSNDWLLPQIVFGFAITLVLLAVISGVVSLRRNPTPASRKIAKMGLLLIVILFILLGLLWINDKIHGG